MEKQKINVKKVLEYKDAVSYIEDLAKSFKSGTIVVESGREQIILKPSDQVSVKVEAKIKKDRQKIGFELSWGEEYGEDLRISDTSSTTPAVQPESGAPAVHRKAKTPAAQKPAMTPAKTETAHPPAKTETKAKPKAKAMKATPKKNAAKKSAPKKTASKKK